MALPDSGQDSGPGDGKRRAKISGGTPVFPRWMPSIAGLLLPVHQMRLARMVRGGSMRTMRVQPSHLRSSPSATHSPRPLMPSTFRITVVFSAVLLTSLSAAQAADETVDADRQARLNERYVQLLKRNPREGTAFDRVFSFHSDRNSLSTFVEELRLKAKESPDDGAVWMLAGMFAARQHDTDVAIEAFQKAERLRDTDAIASWYLGRSLMTAGRLAEAAAACERALTKMPTRPDQQEIFRALGRLYHRSRQTEKSLEVWSRYEAAFPGDSGVQEEITSVLIEAGRSEDALKRLQQLATSTRDIGKAVQYGIRAAEMQLELGRTSESRETLHDLAQRIRPGSWLQLDLRRRIDDSFLRDNDYDGLVAWYEQIIQQQTDDLDAMIRLARVLEIRGDETAARAWLEKAVQKAPADSEPREALIAFLTKHHQPAEAIHQFEELSKHQKLSAEQTERWGRLYLRRVDLNEDERNRRAADVWRMLRDDRPDDPAAAVRLAGLYSAAGMHKLALQEYRQAVALAPDVPDYHEYLGTCLNTQGQTAEAIAAWKQAAADELHNTENLIRLSDILARHGFSDEAANAAAEACELTPDAKNFLRYGTLLYEAGRFDAALKQLDIADAAANDLQQSDRILETRILCLEASGELAAQTEALERKVAAAPTPEDLMKVARYREALGRLSDAARSVRAAIEMQPDDVRVLVAGARILEKAGLLSDASAAWNSLLRLDPRNRTRYLQSIAELEHKLGRSDAALSAARALIDAAPDNPEHYRNFAELCFAAGETDRGLETLREAVRVNPADVVSLSSLAQALADDFQTQEAIETYWRLFGKSDTIDRRQTTARSLAALYQRKDQFRELIAELQDRHRQTADPELVYCLAAAWEAAGDARTARTTLESLLRRGQPDSDLLRELSILAEQSGDLRAAADYQRQLNKTQPSVRGTDRLANLLLQAGEIDLPQSLLMRYSGGARLPQEVIATIDQLIEKNELPIAQRLADELVVQNRTDWEARLRRAVIAWKTGDRDRARAECDAILSLKLPAATPPRPSSAQGSRAAVAESGRTAPPVSDSAEQRPAPLRRVDRLQQFGRKLHLAGVSHGSAIAWEPADFGEARGLALFLKLRIDGQSKEQSEELIESLLKTARAHPNQEDSAWDAWHAAQAHHVIHSSRSDHAVAAGELVGRMDDVEARFAWLLTVAQRVGGRFTSKEQLTPLSDTRLDLLLEAFAAIRRSRPDWLSYTGGVHRIAEELDLAGRPDAAGEVIRELMRHDAHAAEIESVFDAARRHDDARLMLESAERFGQQAAHRSRDAARTSWRQKYALTALTAAAQGKYEIAEQVIRSFLIVRATVRSADADEHDRSAALTDFDTAVHHQVYRNNAEAQPLMIRTLAFDEHWNRRDVEFLVNIREFFRRIEQLDLMGIVTEFRESAEGRPAALAEFVLAHLKFMQKRHEEAVIHLIRAAELLPDDTGLRLRLAGWFQQNGHEAEALSLLDTIDSSSEDILRESELLALDLASRLGNHSRATIAAKRLNGLQLTPATVESITRILVDLGLEERAKVLSARFDGSSGSEVNSLASRMQQRAEKGDSDVAVEIAHEILRQTEGLTRGAKTGDSIESIRQEAVRVLERAGKLDAVIERVRQQIRRSPDSEHLHRALLELLVSSGRMEDAEAVRQRLNEIAPVTMDGLLKEASDLERRGKHHDAGLKYLQVFAQDPQRFSSNYNRYLNTLRKGGLLADMAEILLQYDLRKLQNNYFVVNETIRTLFDAARADGEESLLRERALRLFEEAWKLFPNNRTFLMSEIQDESLWDLPLMIDYAAEGLIPQTVQQAMASPWKIVAGRMTVQSPASGQPGRVEGTITRLCRALQSRNALPGFIEKLQPATERFPHWHGGRLLLAVLLAKSGRTEAAADVLSAVVEAVESDGVPESVALLVAQELRSSDETLAEPLISLLRIALNRSGPVVLSNYEQSAGCLLAELYAKQQRHDEARAEVYRSLIRIDESFSGSAAGEAEALRRQELYVAAGRHLLQMKYFVSASHVLAEAERFSHGKPTALSRRVTELRRRAIASVTVDEMAEALARTPVPLHRHEFSVAVSGLLLVHEQRTSQPIRSLLLDRLRQLASRSSDADRLVTSLTEILAGVEPRPEAAVAGVLLGHQLQNEQLLAQSIAVLSSLLKNASAQTLRAGDLVFWPAARVLATIPEESSLADALATRASAAAASMEDTLWLEALLQEQGDTAVANGNPEAADKAWTSLLDAILADRGAGPFHDASQQGTATTSALQELRSRLLNVR